MRIQPNRYGEAPDGDLRALSRELQGSEAQNANLRREVTSLRGEIATTQRALREAQTQNDVLRREVEATRRERQGTEYENADLRRQRERLHEQLIQKEAELEQAKENWISAFVRIAREEISDKNTLKDLVDPFRKFLSRDNTR